MRGGRRRVVRNCRVSGVRINEWIGGILYSRECRLRKKASSLNIFNANTVEYCHIDAVMVNMNHHDYEEFISSQLKSCQVLGTAEVY
jgi:hypothetical protein